MSQRYRFELSYEGRLAGSPGYPLYGLLMERLPQELGEELHRPDRFLLRQSIRYDQREGRAEWTVDLFDPRLAGALAPLAAAEELVLREAAFRVRRVTVTPLPQPAELFPLAAERFGEARRCRVSFLTPCTFRQQDRYVLFPTVELMVQSLIARWNLLHPETPLEDADAHRELCRGLAIEDYRLHSTRGQIKGALIPAFCGSVVLGQRLAAPLRQLWQVLLLSGEQTGIGVKTALGMGAMAAEPVLPRREAPPDSRPPAASHPA